jgi:hypothetical protein
MNIETKLIDITPEIALEWLTRNTHNRPPRPSVIKAFKADILAGRVQETHEAIAFTCRDIEKRVLVDGQNRLTAIAQLGEEGHDNVSVRLLVAFGVPLEAQKVINTGAKRSAVDQLIIEGHTKATSVHVSIARAMRAHKKFNSIGELVDFCRQYWKAIHYMANLFHKGLHVRGVNIAPVAGACARAYVLANAAERDAIRNFAMLLTAPQPEYAGISDRHNIVAEHRAWLREQAQAETRNAAAGRGEMFWRTIESLRQWLGKPKSDRPPFVLPGETW